MVVKRPAKKPKVDIRTLASEWDGLESVRTYLRDTPKQPLFHDNIKTNVRCACILYVFEMLKAILLRSCSVASQPQPSVNPLREQIKLLYKKAKREPDAGEIIGDSWHIRKFLALVKLKTKKELVSTVP